jgi:hypothetical protein
MRSRAGRSPDLIEPFTPSSRNTFTSFIPFHVLQLLQPRRFLRSRQGRPRQRRKKTVSATPASITTTFRSISDLISVRKRVTSSSVGKPSTFFNHAQYSGANATARYDRTAGQQVNALFRQVSSTRTPRVMQASLRFVF